MGSPMWMTAFEPCCQPNCSLSLVIFIVELLEAGQQFICVCKKEENEPECGAPLLLHVRQFNQPFVPLLVIMLKIPYIITSVVFMDSILQRAQTSVLDLTQYTKRFCVLTLKLTLSSCSPRARLVSCEMDE